MSFAPLIRSDSVSLATVMCNDIAEALSFYVGIFGFNIKCDETIKGERFVVAMPPILTEFTPTCSLRFRQAVSARDKAAVGNQGGDGIFLQIESDDWETVYGRLQVMGAKILDRRPREEKRYRVVTIVDPMGNLVNFIERNTTTLGEVFTKDVGIKRPQNA
jgi:catechol 2,3-dioxygenase-like lactoylglutathione lyase family enzyme